MNRTFAVILLLAAVVYGQNVVQLCQENSGRAGSHFARNPNNCSEFYNCQGDLSYLLKMACGRGTVFSQSQQVCVYRNSYYDDCDKQVYGGKYDDSLCVMQSGMNRDPNDCNRFIPCFERTSFPSMACQEGLYFSFSQQRCMEPAKAGCRNYTP